MIYHGRPYQFTTDINELVDAPKELVDRYFLKPFHLLDLNQIDDEVIKQNKWASILEFTLKHILDPDMLPYLKDFMPILMFIDQNGGRDVLGIMLQYILERAKLSDDNEFFHLINTSISHETGEEIMTLAERLTLKGELEGEIKLIKKMLANGVEPAFIAKNTGFSIEKIKEIQKNTK